MTPKVSVLICTYNAEKYINATINSILDQSYKDFELLILDNDSKDNTVKHIQSFKDPRIKLFTSKKNLGPFNGLNFLLEKAKGKYIAISDHDDIRNPTKLAKQIPFLDSHPEFVGCGTNTLVWFESDHMGYEYFLGEKSFFALHSSFVYRNDGFRYPDIMYMNDAVFERYILCNNEKRIYNLKEPLTFRRIIEGANNLSYKWYKVTRKNLKTVFSVHPAWYALAITGFELMRKIVYPMLHKFKATNTIDKIERFPFWLLGRTIRKYTLKDLEHMGFIIS